MTHKSVKPFDREKIIKDYANREADERWAKTKVDTRLPKVEIVKVKGRAGFINFIRQFKV